MINSASTYPDDRFNIVWDTLPTGMADEPLPRFVMCAAGVPGVRIQPRT